MTEKDTQVFQDPGPSPQPESQPPDQLDFSQIVDHEEYLASLTRQLVDLNTMKMNGLTKKIKKRNFPDVPRAYLEDARYVADTTKIIFLKKNAQVTPDQALQSLFNEKAAKITKRRDERFKKFLEGKPGKPNEVKLQQQPIPQPRGIKPLDGMYL